VCFSAKRFFHDPNVINFRQLNCSPLSNPDAAYLPLCPHHAIANENMLFTQYLPRSQ
jgi:hypothetical protein